MDTAQQWCQDCVDDVVECPHWKILACKRDHYFSRYWLLLCNLCMYALYILLMISGVNSKSKAEINSIEDKKLSTLW